MIPRHGAAEPVFESDRAKLPQRAKLRPVKRKFLLTAIGLLTLAVLIALVLLWPPGPEVNDVDLRPARRQIADQDNGFNYLQQAADQIHWPEDRLIALYDIAAGKSWDPNLAQEFVNRQATALELIDRALTCREIQVRAASVTNQDFPYLSKSKSYAQLLLIQAEVMFHQGKEAEAFERAKQVVQLGNLMEDSNGPLIHYLVGLAVKSMGLQKLRQFAGQTKLPVDELLVQVHRLDTCVANATGLTNTFKAEYQFGMKAFEDMKTGKSPNASLPGQSSPVLGWLAKGPVRLLFNLARTRALMAAVCRTCLKSIPRNYETMPLAELRGLAAQRSRFRRIVGGNLIGETLAYSLIPVYEGLLAKKCQENVTVAATQALLAIKCYQLKHGRLPDNLAALVPEFLPRVPVDDFDGKPLRYLKDKKLIHSIGKNLRDEHGASDDIVFPIDF